MEHKKNCVKLWHLWQLYWHIVVKQWPFLLVATEEKLRSEYIVSDIDSSMIDCCKLIQNSKTWGTNSNELRFIYDARFFANIINFSNCRIFKNGRGRCYICFNKAYCIMFRMMNLVIYWWKDREFREYVDDLVKKLICCKRKTVPIENVHHHHHHRHHQHHHHNDAYERNEEPHQYFHTITGDNGKLQRRASWLS